MYMWKQQLLPGTGCRLGPPGSGRPSEWTVLLWQTELDPPDPSVQHDCLGQRHLPDRHPAIYKESFVISVRSAETMVSWLWAPYQQKEILDQVLLSARRDFNTIL